KRLTPGHLKGQVVRVDCVKLSVNQLHFEVDHRITGDRPSRRGILYSLLHRRSPLLRYGATKNLIDELETFAPRHAFKYASRFGKLTAASSLFLVPPDDFSAAPERFEVGNFGRMNFNFDAVPSLQLIHCDFDVSLSRTRKQKFI